jgi:L-fuconolactonase
MGTNDDWLAQVTEATLEPDMPICDPHHHLWDFQHERIEPRYMLDEILKDTGSGHNIVSTVFIQCATMFRADGPEAMKPVGEVEFANGIAAMAASGLYGKTRVAAGIVGYADMMLGSAAGDVLDAQIAAGNGRFKGIRHMATWDADPAVPNGRFIDRGGLLMEPAYREGVRELTKRGLTFEGWCYHPQLPEMIDLARAHPDQIIIMNHLAAPLGLGGYAGRREEVFEVWKNYFAELATCPNVVAKLGGLNMEYLGFGWQHRPKPPTSDELVAATRPYFDFVIEKFGPDRCMWESNFPVDKLSSSYNILWNSFKKISKDFTAGEKAKLFHDTATRIYDL